mmetsp:Transcript_30018/g.54704  ORF Transcript_30018/g.54704 Transcript_30018/m.54704 type:complete len:238 (+) Transcript_30018:410-1123(+)
MRARRAHSRIAHIATQLLGPVLSKFRQVPEANVTRASLHHHLVPQFVGCNDSANSVYYEDATSTAQCGLIAKPEHVTQVTYLYNDVAQDAHMPTSTREDDPKDERSSSGPFYATCFLGHLLCFCAIHSDIDKAQEAKSVQPHETSRGRLRCVVGVIVVVLRVVNIGFPILELQAGGVPSTFPCRLVRRAAPWTKRGTILCIALQYDCIRRLSWRSTILPDQGNGLSPVRESQLHRPK